MRVLDFHQTNFIMVTMGNILGIFPWAFVKLWLLLVWGNASQNTWEFVEFLKEIDWIFCILFVVMMSVTPAPVSLLVASSFEFPQLNWRTSLTTQKEIGVRQQKIVPWLTQRKGSYLWKSLHQSFCSVLWIKKNVPFKSLQMKTCFKLI